MSRIADIKARCEKATEGPWGTGALTVHGAGGDWLAVHSESATMPARRFLVVAACGPASNESSGHDAAFIAHSRADVPYLVARVERLEAELRNCAEWIERYEEWSRGDVPGLSDNGVIRFEGTCAAAREARAALEESE